MQHLANIENQPEIVDQHLSYESKLRMLIKDNKRVIFFALYLETRLVNNIIQIFKIIFH
jgi:hypothetical protein